MKETQNNFHPEDFTETAYRQVLRQARTNWRFSSFCDFDQPGRICLWRHDIDLSVHRAHQLARIENEEGISATYFILLHSEFYNTLEEEVYLLVREILDLGHHLGLHFDPLVYQHHWKDGSTFEEMLHFEKNILETLFHQPVESFSLHNPTEGEWLQTTRQDHLAGMVNTYSTTIQNTYTYCSDSNGYWRFRRLAEVVVDSGIEKLHVLTHPGWWTPDVMNPRQRISRCIDGRAKKQHEKYDQLLEKMGRENVR